MATREVRTHITYHACDVCGRTLLRGERSEVYIAGGDRKNVCELCKTRALHEGWLREGTVPEYAENDPGRERNGSLLRRLRPRREPPSRGRRGGIVFDEPPAGDGGAPAPRGREPRGVRAVPTSAENKCAAAMECFNLSEHKRTIAGVARSLGAPAVSVRASSEGSSLVTLAVSWELCWYRYEVDLGETRPEVRAIGQGYELGDLDPLEREPNALADERGALVPAG